ncbi:DsbA family protein [Aquibium carbonis]|uniref:DsbA family protein n=1 Tax=Aquibium carbonis TaxID=2495581 RepID=A0A429YE38_9HYPH|nr:DsbA family protein [Aquibium carbonis]RST79725.1 DsbA family protein [Aquibium carbonis]
MKKKLGLQAVRASLLSALFVSGAVLGSGSGIAAEPAADRTAGFSRAEIETIVRDYLIANPEIMLEVQDALEARQRDQQQLAQIETIRAAGDDIFNSAHDGVYGNPDGKYTLVEFFDYNCGYCKRAMADMLEMTKANPNVRFVLKEFPILGPDSQRAHIVGQAFQHLMPEQYGEFHIRLMGAAGRATEESAIKVALSLGADEARLREEMKDPKIADVFNRTYEIANKLGITGTPSYVVGEEVVFGALGRDVLEQKVANLEQCGKATC